MTKSITPKEKELIAIAASIASGCQKCLEYHFRMVLELGCSSDELTKVVADTTMAIEEANRFMQDKAYLLMAGNSGQSVGNHVNGMSDRITELVKIGALAACNSTTLISRHIDYACELGVSSKDLNVAIGMARAVQKKASEFVDQKVKSCLGGDVIEVAAPAGCGCSDARKGDGAGCC